LEEHFLALIRGDKRGLWPALQRLGLRGLSLPYSLGTRWRNWLFEYGCKKTHAVAIPVVSVGNLTLGGTGKTPCVEYIARFYREQDRRVAVLSRGYGAREGRNDEALVLEENLPDVPHLQAADRVALARMAIEELDAEVLVLDDGFQHRRLRRDLDIVLVDAAALWGIDHVFPRGLLREPTSALRRADVVMLTRCDLISDKSLSSLRQRLGRLAKGKPLVETAHRARGWVNACRQTLPLEALGAECAAFCGIGNPDAFRRTLTSLGMEVVDWRVYPDHHPYTRQDIDSFRAWSGHLPPGAKLVTTQKDLVKIQLERLGDHELWALQIQLEVLRGQDLLEEKLLQIVRA
jgi:tetraacyldisaccharide 4'-kinase